MGVIYDKILGKLREGDSGGSGGGSATPAIVEVANIENISGNVLDTLKSGDMVVEVNNGDSTTYMVVFMGYDTLVLSGTYNGNVRNVYYVAKSNVWQHVKTTNTVVSVADITAINSTIVANLQPGDVVAETRLAEGNKTYTYIVATRSNLAGEITLVYADQARLERVLYVYSVNDHAWVYNSRSSVDPSNKADKIYVAGVQPISGMFANTLYEFGTVSANKTFTLAAATDNTIANVWMWTFSTGATAPTITWPNEITMWVGGYPSYIEPNSYYEVRVMNGVATILHASSLDASNSYNSDFNNDF